MAQLLGKILTWIGIIVGAVTSFVGLVVAWSEAIREKLVAVAVKMAGLTEIVWPVDASDTDFGGLGLSLSLVNAFIPLEEMSVLIVFGFGIWTVILVLRWVKSFIPSVSN